MSNDFTVSIEYRFTKYDIACWISTACEGGSGYWAYELHHKHSSNPEDVSGLDFSYESAAICCWGDGEARFVEIDNINNINHKDDDDDDDWYGKRTYKKSDILILNEKSIRMGIALASKWLPKTFSRLVSEDYDAGDADVFLQCCLFPKYVEEYQDVKYG